MKECLVEECFKIAKGKYCSMHYARLNRTGNLELQVKEYSTTCKFDDCDNKRNPNKDGLYCSKHRARLKRNGSLQLSDVNCQSCGDLMTNVRKDKKWCSQSCANKGFYDADPRRKLEHNIRRERMLKEQIGNVPVNYWELLINTFGEQCLACGSTENLTLDHVVPLSLGGMHDISNFQILCRSCNSAKHNRRQTDYRGGVQIA